MRDIYGGSHAQCSGSDLTAYEGALLAFLQHRPAEPWILQSLASAPSLRAQLLFGFGQIMLARRETLAVASTFAATARSMLGDHAHDPIAASLCAALEKAAGGFFDDAIHGLSALVKADPRDLLVVKALCGLQFVAGHGAAMAETTSHSMQAWTEDMPGFGNLLGCHAFALEEAGEYEAAERLAREACARDSEDLWAAHALSHVFEMTGRDREGLALFSAAHAQWRRGASFGRHLLWHAALYHFNLGQYAQALEVYDEDIRPGGFIEYRDMANGVSLLCRLQQEGVPVDERFEELAGLARQKAADTSLIFASLHHLLALLASGDGAGVESVVDALVACAQGESSQAPVARDIGLPVARILTASSERLPAQALAALLQCFPRLGGSHAQRDVFLRTLALQTAASKDGEAVTRIAEYRNRLRRSDRFCKRIEDMALAAMWKPRGASPLSHRQTA